MTGITVSASRFRMHRRGAILVVLALIGALAMFVLTAPTGASAAPGGPAQPTTSVAHDVTETFSDLFPCSPDPDAVFDITIHAHVVVEHTTLLGPDVGGGTFTQTGTFVAKPQDSSLATYTGHFTEWDGGNNHHSAPGTSMGTGTFTIIGSGSDGSSIHVHEVRHGVFDDTGTLLSGFDKAFCK